MALPCVTLGKSPALKPMASDKRANEVSKKLKTIRIPRLQFFESPLPDVLAELRRLSRQFDLAEKDPARKGVNLIMLNPENESPPKVTLTLNGMALGQALGFVTEMVGWNLDVRDDAVIVSKGRIGRIVVPRETEFFEVARGTVLRMTGIGGAGGGKGPPDPFGQPTPKGDGGKIKKYFESHGVTFDHNAGDSLVFDGFQIMVTAPDAELKKITRLLAKLDPDRTRQVTLDVLFLPLHLAEVRKKVEALQKTKGELGHPLELDDKTLENLLKGIPEAERPHAMRLTSVDGQPGRSENRHEIFPANASKNAEPLISADSTVEFVPRIGKGETVALELNLKHSYFAGFREIKQGQRLPSIRTQTINSSLLVTSGNWLVVGGHGENDDHPMVLLLRALVHL